MSTISKMENIEDPKGHGIVVAAAAAAIIIKSNHEHDF